MNQLQPFDINLQGISHVIIEMFGGDNNLSSFVMEDLQEMAVGSRGSFAVIALTDFADEQASVKALTPEKGLHTVEQLGEIDTGDPETLADFLARALVTAANVPHKALGFWDHGSGVFDEYDPNETDIEKRLRAVPRHLRSRSRAARRLFVSPARYASQPDLRAMLHDDTNGGVLTNHEAHGVLKAAFDRAGLAGTKIDLIFSDTCLNGMIEVLEQFREFADVVVASEDLEPGDGWEYDEWLSRMSDNPPSDGAMWGKQAVEAFDAGYRNRPSLHPCTLGAFRTDNELTASMKSLIDALSEHQQEGMKWVSLAIFNTQSFAQHDTFDIHHFVKRLQAETSSDYVREACGRVLTAFDDARVHAVALGDVVKDANGLAFWCPSSKYSYNNVIATYRKLLFDQATGWSAYIDKYRFS